MTKIVINRMHGGFDLSRKAIDMYAKAKGIELKQWEEKYGCYVDEHFSVYMILRDDPDLVAIVEKLGEEANGTYSFLHVVDIPDDVNWYIEEYDGLEWVAERHRKWF